MNPVWPVVVVGSVFTVLFSQVVPMQNKDYQDHFKSEAVQTVSLESSVVAQS